MSLVEKDLKYIWHPCSQMKDYETLLPIVIKRAKGVYLYDENDKEYIDIISSWWCNLLGHNNDKINENIKNQLDKFEHVIFANFSHEPAITLCERLMKIIPKGLCKFNFSDNGSSAIECALKMAFQYNYQIGDKKRDKFMCLSNGYHGETIGALAVGSIDLYSKIYKPMMMDTLQINAPDCYRCPYGKIRDNCNCECICHAEKMFEKYGDTTCAIILEPLLQGSAGMRIYPALYLKKIRDLCDRYGVLLIVDEIATGFFRTGKMFACDRAEISPDIMCISKGLTGGYLPMAITITTQKIYDAFYGEYNDHVAFMHSHTYSGNPLACSAALAVLDILENTDVQSNAKENAVYLNNLLNETFDNYECVGEIRHLGLINAIEIVKDKVTKEGYDSSLRVGYNIYKIALENGLLLRPLGDVLYFNPPLTITKQEIDKAVMICKKSIDKFFDKFDK